MGVEELRLELADLQQQLEALDDELAAVPESAGDVSPRAIGGEIAEERRRLEELEQRELELKAIRDDAEGKLKAEEEAHRQSLEMLMQQATQLERFVRAEAEQEGRQEAAAPHASAQELEDIGKTREERLREMHAELEELQKEDAAVTQNLAALQERAQKEIPELQRLKDSILDEMAAAWASEKHDLMKTYQNNVVIQRELFWHVKRGSYIKQRFVDPRNPKGQFDGKPHDFHDARLKSDEDKLVRELNELKGQLEHQTHEKIRIEKAKDDMIKRWEQGFVLDAHGRPATRVDGTPKLMEGSKAWFTARVTRLKASLAREQRLTRELINENAEMKTIKTGMEAKTRAATEKLKKEVVEQGRQARLQYLEDKKVEPAPLYRLVAKPGLTPECKITESS
eukprot:TRINITY_DN9337_c0_g4_i1.p1 TRINITY_DN9337_c0_g4~~TRINITY_DN9337_c0_g4_i1.p1  ORF type:complete len:423 (+),score=196.35 TRINITY_DN9337_c0_g4_i1:80-1270(+)